jgi:hypothetical protein
MKELASLPDDKFQMVFGDGSSQCSQLALNAKTTCHEIVGA